ncbi:MAG: hypothetical protein IKW08_03785 [Roseburia sp.]|nr:hypothetical protein [Roseburia sp.]
MANIMDHIGSVLYNEVLGRKETHLEEFTFLETWKFFIEMAMENRRVQMCALGIERKGDHYNISQIMLDKNMETIRKNGDFVMGRSIQAYALDDDLLEFLNGDKYRLMKLEVLKNRDIS